MASTVPPASPSGNSEASEVRTQRLRLAGLLDTHRVRTELAGSTGRVGGGFHRTERGGPPKPGTRNKATLSALADAAGVAIENTGLHQEVERREHWLLANAEITRSLLAGHPREEVIALIAERARDIAGAELAVVAVPMAGTETLLVELAIGRGAESRLGLVLPADGGLIGAAFSEAAPVTSADMTRDAQLQAGPQRFAGLGPAVAVPIGAGAGGRVRGVLQLVRGTGGPVFEPEETSTLLGFTRQAALAMLLAESRRDTEEIALLRDHDRIARELRDLAIQRLFATGMTLQSVGSLIEPSQASEQVWRAVDELDETIRIIRSTIFGL